MAISATLNTQAISGGMLTKFRSLDRDTVPNDSFSRSAGLAFSGIDKATFTSSTVKTKLKEGGVGTSDVDITYSNSSGAITWGGKKLNLTGFDPRTEPTLYLQQGGDANEVYIYRDDNSKGFVLDLTTGKLKQNADTGEYTPAATFDPAKSSLIINNSSAWNGNPATGTTGNDVIINRQAAGEIDGGAGDDQIFNYGAGAVSLKGTSGNDAVYTIANSGGTIDLSGSTNTYVKTLGNMTGSTVTLGTGAGLIDATGYTLTDMNITGDGDSAALIAKSILTGTNTISLTADQVGIDVTTLSGELELGTGKNSLVADTITGKVESKGTDSFQFKTVSAGAEIDQSASTNSSVINVTGTAKDATFSFGEGINMLNALGKTLTSVTITDAAASAETEIQAGSIIGTKGGAFDSIIDLQGKSTIGVSGAINHTEILTGDGATTITAKSISGSSIDTSAHSGTDTQKITVTGKIDDTTLTMTGTNEVTAGSGNKVNYSGGANADTVAFKGAVNDSTISLGAGTNAFYATSTGVAGGKGQAITGTDIIADGATTIEGGAYTASAAGNAITLEGTLAAHSVTLGSVAAKAGGRVAMTLGIGTDSTAQALTILGAVKDLDYIGNKGDDSIKIDGAISNSTFDLGDGANKLIAQKGTAGAFQAMNNVDITAGDGNTTIMAGAYTAGKSGGDNNTISLGDGNNTVTLNSVSGKKVGGDLSSLTMELGGTGNGNQTLSIKGATKNLEYTGANGNDVITIEGAISDSSFALGDGANTLTAQKGAAAYQAMSNVDIIAGDGNTTIMAGAYTAGKDGGNNNSISLGNGANTVTLNSVSGKKVGGTLSGLTMELGIGGTDNQTLDILGAAKDLIFTSGGGDDAITIKGAVSESKFTLDAGDDTFIAENNGKGQKLTNVGIDMGDGVATITAGAYTVTDTNTLDGTYRTITLGDDTATINLDSIAGGKTEKANITGATGDVTLTVKGAVSALNYNANVSGTTTGASTITLRGAVSKSDFILGNGNNAFTAEKTMTDGKLTTGNGDDVITLLGAINKVDFELGNGDNELDASGQTLTAVNITGGDDNDIVKYGNYKGVKGTTYTIELGDGAVNTVEIVA